MTKKEVVSRINRLLVDCKINLVYFKMDEDEEEIKYFTLEIQKLETALRFINMIGDDSNYEKAI